MLEQSSKPLGIQALQGLCGGTSTGPEKPRVQGLGFRVQGLGIRD